VGSIPTTPAIFLFDGGRGEGVNAPDCGSGTRGFDSHRSPHTLGYSQAVRQRVLVPSFLGSNPSSPAKCGSSSVVEHHLAKVGVAGSNPVFRSIIRRYSQVVRQRSAKPLSPVQIRLPPSNLPSAKYIPLKTLLF
jgi:hypothetical protein